ncbi:hypothetical protein C0995_000004 [Termitomyces sp. Mi166|nr:hypothetical protein C0995_000004 [Termitomyces sp. Mi166\
MAVADLQQSGLHDSQPFGGEDPIPNTNVHLSLAPDPSEAHFATCSSAASNGVDARDAENAVFRNGGPSNNRVFSDTHATEQTSKYNSQSSDTISLNAINALLSKGALEDLLRSIKAMNLPQLPLAGSIQPQVSSMPPEQLRNTLLPVILKNAQRRSDFNDKLVTKVEVGLREALTDQFCDSLSQKLKTINREIQATRGSKEDAHATATVSITSPRLKLATGAPQDDQSSTPGSARDLPRAPRAMRLGNSATLTSQGSMESSAFLLRRSGSRDTLPFDFGRLGHWPSDQEPPGSVSSARESLERASRWDRSTQKHESNGIPIPLDSSFFTTPADSTTRIKRESPGPSKDEKFLTSRLRRSRSPHRRSLSASSRHSRSTRRRFSRHEISNHHLSRSPRPRSRDRRRSRSHSRSHKTRSPPLKRRRYSFSRSHSPRQSGSHRSRSRPRENSSRKQHLPPAHRKASFHDRKSFFRHRSPEPPVEPRRTPVHMRGIDRTRPSPPPYRRDFISDRPGLSVRHVSRSPEPLSAASSWSRRHASPSRAKLSRSPDSASYRGRQLPSSSPRTRSPSPVRVNFRHRFSCPPDENHPGLIGLRTSMRAAPQDMAIVKREPDVEDFTAALYRSPSPAAPPAIVPSPSMPGSPQSNPVPPTNIPSASPPPVPVVLTPPPFPPPEHVFPVLQSGTDSNRPVQESDIPPPVLSSQEEEARNQPPLSEATGTEIPPSSGSSLAPALYTPSEVLPHPSPQQSLSILPSSPTLSQPSKPPVDSSMAMQPCFSVPGFWFAKHGHDQADIVDCEFEVNSEIAQKWLSGSSTNTPEAPSERLSLRLLCIPVELLQNIYQVGSVPELVDSGALTSSVASVETVWPEQGSLLVQMNPSKPHKRSWLPEHMGPTSPGLDITDSVREGKNILRLIQLEDMTNRVFMLQALLLPPAPKQNSTIYWTAADFNFADHFVTCDVLPATIEII